ncbi:DUF2399 domain-containing protein [Saccharothrix sp. ST-888]|uniref:DUF2399 domain-containing protein n=1 Tax=Saccharothrix sp. ST-888 TaxID=1427391 RepID=UPI0005ECDDED|nr:DUF2399 domain-containing protein [Saccharothrix sp. ST-888]KJK59177.1 hypothetical protein UK12_05625 [Saccharothrix sp. ST-888]
MGQAWRDDGAEVPLGGPARRALPALLPVRPGEVVSADRLAEEVDPAAADGDHRIAYARCQEQLREYATGCRKMGDGVAKLMVPDSRLMASALNRHYKVMPYLPGKNMAARIARRTAENITLPDYPNVLAPAPMTGCPTGRGLPPALRPALPAGRPHLRLTPAPWDPALIDAMAELRVAVVEEVIADVLLEDLDRPSK